MLHQVQLLQPLIAARDVLLNACLQQWHFRVLHLSVFRQVSRVSVLLGTVQVAGTGPTAPIIYQVGIAV